MKSSSVTRSQRRTPKPTLTKPAIQPRGDAVIEKILERAMSTFLKHGFDGTSIDVLARETKTSKATIYRHFPDKEALFTAIVDRALARFRTFPDLSRCRKTNGRDLLIDFARAYLDIILDPARIELSRVYIFEIGKFAELERMFARFDDRDARAYVQLFRDVAETQLFEFDDPARAAESFWGLVVAPAFLHRLFRARARSSDTDATAYIEGRVSEFLRLYPARR
jgi:TetR/AcrR family transcriptional repressor of mexJK operon